MASFPVIGLFNLLFDSNYNMTVMYLFFAVAPPHVAAYKHSEHGNENDKVVLVCVSHGYPLPTDWLWFKQSNEEIQVVSFCHTQNDINVH